MLNYFGALNLAFLLAELLCSSFWDVLSNWLPFQYLQPVIFANLLRLQTSWNIGYAKISGFFTVHCGRTYPLDNRPIWSVGTDWFEQLDEILSSCIEKKEAICVQNQLPAHFLVRAKKFGIDHNFVPTVDFTCSV